jgi:hypothetical protein
MCGNEGSGAGESIYLPLRKRAAVYAHEGSALKDVGNRLIFITFPMIYRRCIRIENIFFENIHVLEIYAIWM